MTAIRMLGPGSLVPGWAEALESSEFASAWGPMGEHEIMWLMDGRAFARWRAVPDIGEAELLRMAVAPGHRRSGLARLLMESCTKYLAECGCASLRLEARSSNVPAQRLYESLGWRQAGARRAYYGDGEDALLYALEL